jgi:hypothetical protein
MLFLGSVLLLSSGCTSFKIFQKKVPEAPTNLVTPAIQDGLNFINTTLPDLTTGEVVSPEKATAQAQVKEMVSVLVRRVGSTPEPELDPIILQNKITEEAVKIAKSQAKANEFLGTYAGKKVEGTGLDIAGLLNGSTILIIIVLCVLFPALLPLILKIIDMAVRSVSGVFTAIVDRARATQTAKQTVSAIDAYVADSAIPEFAKKALKTQLGIKQDEVVKAHVNKLQGKPPTVKK